METLILPVRVFNYRFVNATDLSSTVTQGEIYAYFEKVNQIWLQAKIEFSVISIDTIDINDEIFLINDYENFTNREFRMILEDLSETHIPVKSMTNEAVWTVVFIDKFPHPAGGVWSFKTEIIFFAQHKNDERVVENILAHELGHSLSLLHVNALRFPDNLMKTADGNPQTASRLTARQIEKARQTVLRILKTGD